MSGSRLIPYPNYVVTNDGIVNKLPEGWKITRLKYLISKRITDGPHTTPQFIEKGVPFLSVDGIQKGELFFKNCRYISNEDHLEFCKKVKPMKGDILMGKSASTGKIARVKVDFEFSIWSPLARIRPNSKIASEFLEYVLKSAYCQAQIDNLCTFNTQANISMQDIPKIKVIVPPLETQYAISNFLDRVLMKLQKFESFFGTDIPIIQEYRMSIITKAVTGEIDIRESA